MRKIEQDPFGLVAKEKDPYEWIKFGRSLFDKNFKG